MPPSDIDTEFRHCSSPIMLSPSPFSPSLLIVPQLKSCFIYRHIYICVCMWLSLYIFIYMHIKSRFCIWETTFVLKLAYFTSYDLPQYHPFSCEHHNFILFYGWIILYWLYIPHFFVHSLVERHLGWFQSLSVANSAEINMDVQLFLLYPDLHSFSYIPRSGISRALFSVFFGNLHTIFHSGCTMETVYKCSFSLFSLQVCKHGSTYAKQQTYYSTLTELKANHIMVSIDVEKAFVKIQQLLW
jgi:hypothetical protein